VQRLGELTAAIWDYLAERNLKPQRYEWRTEGKAILEKIRRARKTLASQSPVKKDISETHNQLHSTASLKKMTAALGSKMSCACSVFLEAPMSRKMITLSPSLGLKPGNFCAIAVWPL